MKRRKLKNMKETFNGNPLIEDWKEVHALPPFTRIKPNHFGEAVAIAIREAESEIKKIAGNKDEPSFENTIEALENAGKRLSRIAALLFNLNSADTSPELQAAAQHVSPLLTRFSNNVTLNRKLFARINKLHESGNLEELDTEQRELLLKRYREFILGGAGLSAAKRRRFRKINEELSSMALKFEENILAETNDFELHITDSAGLAGLPHWLVESSRTVASEKGCDGWIFNLQHPSYIPFMQYSENRELRRNMYLAYASRCCRKNSHNNSRLVRRIVRLRLELAQMTGYSTFAGMALADRMASDPATVRKFLSKLHAASRSTGRKDFIKVAELARRSGLKGRLERWDWLYYSEKLRKELFDFDDEALKPYFSLDSAEAAVFDLANRLYGLSFVLNNDLEKYHTEVRAYEIYGSGGDFLAVLYTDYHPRKGKNGGAWMTSYREQYIAMDKDVRPVISIVANFTRATESRPALLSFSELTTLLHEFGHALHGIMSKCRYESLSGTNVARDFVELPSQLMENYVYEKEWLDTWARHYESGTRIPAEMIQKIRAASYFNEGYSCQRQLGFALLDMCWHTIRKKWNGDIVAFEKAILKKTDFFRAYPGTCISTSFAHIFSGGYAAAYYGYKWAEILDADAFSLFSERGIFNKETADSFRINILEKGGSEKPSVLYRRFRGQEPTMDAFLKRSGLLEITAQERHE
jgi:peptidyl-dipeptidase Dcp